MNYRHIEVFFAVMTSGTVTEAAKRLGVSQPSVTTTIQKAESKLGFDLFHREGGRLVPTAEARVLFEEAERAHDALDALRSLAQRLREGEGGYLRVAAVPSISLELLPEVVTRFHRSQPGFNFSLSTLNTEEMLQQLDARQGAFQLGFSFGDLGDSGFSTQVVGEAELFVVLPAAWEQASESQLSLSDLADRPYIAGFDSTPAGQVCSALFSEAQVEPRVVARIHTHHLAGRLVERGMGYALLEAVTVRALQHDPEAGSVAVRPISGRPGLPLTAVYRAVRSTGKAVHQFVECFALTWAELKGHGDFGGQLDRGESPN